MTKNFSSPWARVPAVLLGTVLALAAIVLVVGALLMGLVVACGGMLWAVLSGRRPGPVNLRWGVAQPSRMPRHPPAGEVVDVLAREVEQPPVR